MDRLIGYTWGKWCLRPTVLIPDSPSSLSTHSTCRVLQWCNSCPSPSAPSPDAGTHGYQRHCGQHDACSPQQWTDVWVAPTQGAGRWASWVLLRNGWGWSLGAVPGEGWVYNMGTTIQLFSVLQRTRGKVVPLSRLLFIEVIDSLYWMKLFLGWGNPPDKIAPWVRMSVGVKL